MEQAINIEQLLSKGHYKIPLYQRNFAWEKEEIQQLLEDILTSNINSNYYLGTLVLSDFNGSYEIIDGQQRFTVLHLINAYLNDHYENLTKKTNIYFEARPNIQRLLSDLAENNCDEIDIDKYLNVKGEGINAIMEGLQSIKDFFSTKTKEDKDAFKERFYKEVNIFEIFLPQNTNLNHYFEVMNNRGEQLEKHEILKAKFIGNIDTNTSEEKGKKEIQKAIFSQIWDACADMNSHVKANFPKKMSKKLFNDDIEGFPTKDAVLKNDIFTNSNNEHENKESTITQIIEDYNLPEEFNQEKKEDPPERFKSIINFSNFLLQFLKLYQTERDISLDDKFLLKEFCYPDNLSDSINFIVNLLR